ncbi:MAG: hypothetical protein SPG07_05560 [Coriobacteriales bacterium]|nr:hypothetical protein [Coriobacteriaceae bacterium]MDY2723263.1 hypothetical protein [Coriobacteriales bacterium]MDY5662060.1 hypothetical protein [Coriobacteriales bacterium]
MAVNVDQIINNHNTRMNQIETAEKETDNVFVTAWEAELKNSLANQPTD